MVPSVVTEEPGLDCPSPMGDEPRDATGQAPKAEATISEPTRAYLRRVCVAFMAELRAILTRRGPEIYASKTWHRRPCGTCAFRESTDSWQGFELTCLHLMEALRDDQPFWCHSRMEHGPDGYVPPSDPSEMELCAAWVVVVGDPAAKTAIDRAVRLVGEMPEGEGTQGGANHA